MNRLYKTESAVSNMVGSSAFLNALFVVSYKHEVLVNHLVKIAQEKCG